MIVIFFVILFLLGVIQLTLYYRQSQRLKRLHKIESFLANVTINEKLSGFTYSMAIAMLCSDFYRHLKGKNKSVTLRHAIILLISLIGGAVINNQYIQVRNGVFFPILTVTILYILYLRSKNVMRIEFETGFSEALNIINNSVSAGNSLLQGIEQCGKKIDGIVGDEFKIVSQRLDIGEDIERIFMDSYKRLLYREYYFFIVTVLINMKGGGEVKEIISRLSKSISNARVMNRKKYAKTAESRSSIKILIMLPIGFFFFLKFLSPENFDILLNDPTGRMILYYCIASELFGLFCVWTMMNKI